MKANVLVMPSCQSFTINHDGKQSHTIFFLTALICGLEPLFRLLSPHQHKLPGREADGMIEPNSAKEKLVWRLEGKAEVWTLA